MDQQQSGSNEPQVSPPQQVVAAPTQPEKPSKGKLPKWVTVVGGVLGGIALFVALIFGIVTFATNDAVKVSNKVVGYIQDNKPDEIYKLASDAFKETTSAEDLESIVDSITGAYQGETKITNKEIVKHSGAPGQATVIYTVATDTGEKYIRVVLLDNGSWQVQNFEASPTKLEIITEE